MDKGGRPLKEIDREQFEKLCGLHCTQVEIADWFGCTDDTVQAWCLREYGKGFSEIYKQKKSKGAVSIRRKQMEVAQSGNPTLLIWLGKQYLGQSDKQEIEQTVKGIEINIGKDEENL